VLQADGGTRTASVTGAAVALADACTWLVGTHGVKSPFARLVSAISVGVVGGVPVLDLAYIEDKIAEVDANVVVADPEALVEVQGTGEQGTFSRAELDQLLDLAMTGTRRLFTAQKAALGL
jgi:ribonuclease PH